MASLRFLPFQSIKTLLYNNVDMKTFAALQHIRCISTSVIAHKRTPHTVGTMSWVRAARRRRYLEQQMKDFEKSDHAIMREEQLARTVPEIEFRLPCREVREINENVMNQLHIKPKVFLSKDKQTVICYHPPPRDYPESFTKPAVGRSLFAMDQKLVDSFRQAITDSEIAEGSKLQEKDPRVWSTNTLSKLFKVKPEVVKANIPVTRKQKEVAMAERSLYESMSVMKRRKLRELQNWERAKYVRETRGKADARLFKSMGVKSKPKTYVPHKF